jgi:hypothetical protein
MVHVYLLRDGNGKVVDVGESVNPPRRLYLKTRAKSQIGRRTNFYGRTDITQEVVSSWATKKEARAEEGRLKLFYGLEWTERIICTAGVEAGPKNRIKYNTSRRKLTPDQVKEVKQLYKSGKKQIRIAEQMNCSRSAIHSIIHGTGYKDY